MTKRGRQSRHPKGGRVTPKGTRPVDTHGPQWSAQVREPALLRNIGRRLRSGHPLDLLAEVSSLLALVDPRHRGFGRRGGAPGWSLHELVNMFLDVDQLETTAMLTVIAELAGDDDVLATRIRRGLADRSDRLPDWLDRLGETEVYAAQEMVHVLGDGDNIHLAVRFAGGAELTAVVYIDHNVGTLAKDAFVVPQSMVELEALMRTIVDDPDTEWRALDLADARVRIIEAIGRAAMTVPPFESDTWPACRPIVEWLARLMPPGGVGYQRPVWSERDQKKLAERFFASPFGAPLDDADRRGMAKSVIWFGVGYGPGDPLRWSPVTVEIILLDWIPRKLVDDVVYLSKAPDLLRAFVRFCHAERGIRPDLTRDTLAAIDRHEMDYHRTIRSVRPPGPLALLAAMGGIDPEGRWEVDDIDPDDDDFYPPFDFRDPHRVMGERLRNAAGGDEALRALDDRPLPDEDFDWAGIPVDVHEKLSEVLGLTDACCDDLLDVEYRTACRRLLARIATGDPAVFRRRASTATAAAAVCWIVGRDNDLFRSGYDALLVKDLMAHFGIAQGGASQRAETFIRAAGYHPSRRWDMRLGDPALLVSGRRRRIIEQRDEYLTDE